MAKKGHSMEELFCREAEAGPRAEETADQHNVIVVSRIAKIAGRQDLKPTA